MRPQLLWSGRLRTFQKIFLDSLFHFVCMSVFLPYMYGYHMYAWCPRRAEKGAWVSETGVMGNCEKPQRIKGPLWEHQVILIFETIVKIQGWALSMRRNWKVSEVHTSVIYSCFYMCLPFSRTEEAVRRFWTLVKILTKLLLFHWTSALKED